MGGGLCGRRAVPQADARGERRGGRGRADVHGPRPGDGREGGGQARMEDRGRTRRRAAPPRARGQEQRRPGVSHLPVERRAGLVPRLPPHGARLPGRTLLHGRDQVPRGRLRGRDVPAARRARAAARERRRRLAPERLALQPLDGRGPADPRGQPPPRLGWARHARLRGGRSHHRGRRGRVRLQRGARILQEPLGAVLPAPRPRAQPPAADGLDELEHLLRQGGLEGKPRRGAPWREVPQAVRP